MSVQNYKLSYIVNNLASNPRLLFTVSDDKDILKYLSETNRFVVFTLKDLYEFYTTNKNQVLEFLSMRLIKIKYDESLVCKTREFLLDMLKFDKSLLEKFFEGNLSDKDSYLKLLQLLFESEKNNNNTVNQILANNIVKIIRVVFYQDIKQLYKEHSRHRMCYRGMSSEESKRLEDADKEEFYRNFIYQTEFTESYLVNFVKVMEGEINRNRMMFVKVLDGKVVIDNIDFMNEYFVGEMKN